MATTFKNLLDNDTVTTRTLLHENIPITGTIVSSSVYLGDNIKTYTHGMYTTVYDYPYASSSANPLFDISVGFHSTSPASASSDTFAKKKQNLYNHMAQILVGLDQTGSVQKFDRDGDNSSSTVEDKILNAFFLSFSRLLVKDEVKKGSFSMVVGVGTSSADAFQGTMTIADVSGTSNYKINSPAGEFGILFVSGAISSGSATLTDATRQVGLIHYQTGIVTLNASIFAVSGTNSPTASLSSSQQGILTPIVEMKGTGSIYTNVENLFEAGTIDDAGSALRNRIQNITFNNTTELNSTIYLCRVNNNEFNYSSNPTYLSGSKIRTKNVASDAPVSYITTVGLYSADNQLLAVAKLSEPIKKTVETDLILRIRNDW